MKLFAFSASLRSGSLNTQLLGCIAEAAKASGHEIGTETLKSFDIPLYDGDAEEKDGIPAGVTRLGKRIQEADAVILVSPEYNSGIPGVLKNAIDWISRLDEPVLAGKPCMLFTASPGAFGGVRSHPHTRQPIDELGAYLYPKSFALPKAHEQLEAGAKKLKDAKLQTRLEGSLQSFLEYARSFQ